MSARSKNCRYPCSPQAIETLVRLALGHSIRGLATFPQNGNPLDLAWNLGTASMLFLSLSLQSRIPIITSPPDTPPHTQTCSLPWKTVVPGQCKSGSLSLHYKSQSLLSTVHVSSHSRPHPPFPGFSNLRAWTLCFIQATLPFDYKLNVPILTCILCSSVSLIYRS